MADYISRADIMKKLTAAEAQTAIRDMDGGEAYNWFLELVGFAPAADVEPVRHWIPCSERLPDLIPCKAGTAYSEKVIVWTTGRKAMVCVWDGKDWFVPYGFWEVWGKDVTHWMPLPEPPEEGGTENEL